MTDTRSAPGKILSPEDEEVFQLVNEAQRQYERYLAIIESATLTLPTETPATPPRTDAPLTLEIWTDR